MRRCEIPFIGERILIGGSEIGSPEGDDFEGGIPELQIARSTRLSGRVQRRTHASAADHFDDVQRASALTWNVIVKPSGLTAEEWIS